jgi:hypothetical protein
LDKSPGDSLLFKQSALRGVSYALTEGVRRTSMSHSIYSAGRTTYLKVVIVALIAGILVAGLSISMRQLG